MEEFNKNFYVVGISHNTTSPEIIGKCGLPSQDCRNLEDFLIKNSCDEALVLSTCNRVELYFTTSKAPEEIIKYFPDSWKLENFAKNGFKKNYFAIEHLFEVASGLQSQMTGETEILGQVKSAYANAQECGHCASILNPIFQKSAQCAKWIRTNTDIGHGKISIGSVSSELASRIFENLEDINILLIGSGEAGRLVAEALRVRGAKNISISSRTYQNAQTLAQQTSSQALELEKALNSLADFDITITASFADNPLISKEMAESAMETRGGNPIFLIDLGIPRNIEPECSEVEDVYLYNLSDLSKIANENMETRRAEIETARKEISRRAKNLAEKIFGS